MKDLNNLILAPEIEKLPYILRQEDQSAAIYQTLKECLETLGHASFTCEDSIYDQDSLLKLALLLKKECRNRMMKEQQALLEIEHLKTIQTIAKSGSWEVDLTNHEPSTSHYWSDELFNILGIEPGTIDLTYNSYLSLIHPDDRRRFEEVAAETVATGGTYDMEYRLLCKDGTHRIVRDIAETLRDSVTGLPLKLLGVTFDLTETRKIESALSQANTELQTLFNTMEEVFYSVDMEEIKLLQMSPACKKLYGYDIEEFQSDTNLWFKVILEEDQHVIYDSEALLSKGETIRQEYRIRHKDGSIRWLEGKITPSLNKGGKLVRMDGISSDITKRKEAEIAVINNELKFRSLIQNSNDSITVANEKLEFTFVSESMTKMTGFSIEEILGSSILHHIHTDDHSVVQQMLTPLHENPGTPVRFELRFKKKDGTWIWTAGFVNNLLSEPTVAGYIANFRDISNRKEYELALESSNTQLKKTNDELDRFVYSVSHDLRAPLASVYGLIQYTESETTDEDVLDNLRMMKSSVEKLDVFILDILDYARNARTDVKKQKIDFTELLSDLKSNLKFMSAGNSKVEIRLNITEDEIFYSDRSRIYIILNNLISNSIRYYNPSIPDPYVDVIVDLNSDGAHLIVKDNGIGVDKGHHKRIFDMFFRVSDKSNGSGLGLYLVKETIDKLRGGLQFSSEPGIGTEFKIFLPNLN